MPPSLTLLKSLNPKPHKSSLCFLIHSLSNPNSQISTQTLTFLRKPNSFSLSFHKFILIFLLPKPKPILRVPVTSTVEFLSYREYKLAQLNPDNPDFDLKEDVREDEMISSSTATSSSSSRAAPRNPRLAVYQGTFDDITEFFNSGDYVPGANSDKKSDGEFFLVDALMKHSVDINAADKLLSALAVIIVAATPFILRWLDRENRRFPGRRGKEIRFGRTGKKNNGNEGIEDLKKEIKKADIYREEGKIIDSYIMLDRFSSLVGQTIPCHRDYEVKFPKLRSTYKEKLAVVMSELESIKPDVYRQVAELNKAYCHPQSAHSTNQQTTSDLETSQLYPTGRITSQASSRHGNKSSRYRNNYQIVSSNNMQIEMQFQKLSFSLLPPKEETLSRDSIFGPNGLRGKWPEPTTKLKVQHPSKIDSTPLEISGLQGGPHDDGRWSSSAEESCSSGNIIEELLQVLQELLQVNNIRQPLPPPVLAMLKQQDYHLIHPSQVADPRPGPAKSMQDEMSDSNSYQHLHIPVNMMEGFLRLAQENTKKNLETCGLLAGKLKNRVFHITTLIIPKQEATSDSCSAINEEEIFEFQDKLSLSPLGWIHIHPSQTCCMSSIDLHTQFSFQPLQLSWPPQIHTDSMAYSIYLILGVSP
ncbi:hypothetical protein MKW98_005819 [Papaver atlanticum]|uniref:MPN domain-containing protein n=1 Tax=Papaver atlanticum TaxID=357466 RepID=A0AAD4XV25_9MAGN|nr:hypothetical protein MKW98_005819 [Papaver atlanticum]